MAKKKKGGAHAGGHGWFVTFADLMALLMSFFVMLVAFSTQDQQKLKIVAGSMRDAFGVQNASRFSGLIESDGLPTRPKMRNVAHIPPEEASNNPTPDQEDKNKTAGARMKTDREFALASASLRQALQDLPEISELSKHIMFEETKQGLNLEIVDQDGRSMFADGSKQPLERTRRLIQKLAGRLRRPRCLFPLSGTPQPASYRRDRATAASIYRRTVPTSSARFSNRRACRRHISPLWRVRPTPNPCFPTILRWRQIDA